MAVKMPMRLILHETIDYQLNLPINVLTRFSLKLYLKTDRWGATFEPWACFGGFGLKTASREWIDKICATATVMWILCHGKGRFGKMCRNLYTWLVKNKWELNKLKRVLWINCRKNVTEQTSSGLMRWDVSDEARHNQFFTPPCRRTSGCANSTLILVYYEASALKDCVNDSAQ